MKIRLLVYSILLVVVIGAIFYMTERKGMPIGRAHGGVPVPDDISEIIYSSDPWVYIVTGKIQSFDLSDDKQKLYFSISRHSNTPHEIVYKFFSSSSSPLVPIIAMLFQSQEVCRIAAYKGREYDGEAYQVYLLPQEKKEKPQEAELMKKINNMQNYLYWIWRYVWNMSRRLR